MNKKSKRRVTTQQIALDYLYMAQKYRNHGRFRKALNAVRVALNAWPKCAEAYNELGLIHRKLEESQESIAAYQKALKLKPKSAAIALNLGICFLYEGDEASALKYFKRSIKIKPRYAYAHFNLGSTYFDSARYDIAIDHLEKAIRLDPQFLASYEICAMAYLILNEKKKANILFKKAEKIKRQVRLKYVVG